jgi:hypothetical protein
MYYQHLTFCMTKMNPILVKTFGGLSNNIIFASSSLPLSLTSPAFLAVIRGQ